MLTESANSKWQQREFPQEVLALEGGENNSFNIVTTSYHFHINNFQRNKKLICGAEKKSIMATNRLAPFPWTLNTMNDMDIVHANALLGYSRQCIMCRRTGRGNVS